MFFYVSIGLTAILVFLSSIGLIMKRKSTGHLEEIRDHLKSRGDPVKEKDELSKSPSLNRKSDR